MFIFFRKIQCEEEEAHKKYLDNLKQDEILAQQMQQDHVTDNVPPNTPRKLNVKAPVAKPRLKATKMDSYLSKLQVPTAKE